MNRNKRKLIGYSEQLYFREDTDMVLENLVQTSDDQEKCKNKQLVNFGSNVTNLSTWETDQTGNIFFKTEFSLTFSSLNTVDHSHRFILVTCFASKHYKRMSLVFKAPYSRLKHCLIGFPNHFSIPIVSVLRHIV